MTSDRSALDFCYLTTTGRVTGMPHRIEIWFALHESTVYLMAGDRDRSDWVRNLMADPEVTLESAIASARRRARVVEAGTTRMPWPAVCCWRSTVTGLARAT